MPPVYSQFKDQFLKVLHGLDGSIELYPTKVIVRPTWWQRLFARAVPVTVRFREIKRVDVHDNQLERIGVLTIYPVDDDPLSITYMYQPQKHEIAMDIKQAIESNLVTQGTAA